MFWICSVCFIPNPETLDPNTYPRGSTLTLANPKLSKPRPFSICCGGVHVGHSPINAFKVKHSAYGDETRDACTTKPASVSQSAAGPKEASASTLQALSNQVL